MTYLSTFIYREGNCANMTYRSKKKQTWTFLYVEDNVEQFALIKDLLYLIRT